MLQGTTQQCEKYLQIFIHSHKKKGSDLFKLEFRNL